MKDEAQGDEKLYVWNWNQKKRNQKNKMSLYLNVWWNQTCSCKQNNFYDFVLLWS